MENYEENRDSTACGNSLNGVFSSQSSCRGKYSAPLDDPVTDMISLVSESNINTTIQTLQDFDTRYIFSENCSLSAEYLYEKFSEYNLWTEYDYFEYENHILKNVVGTLNGTSDNIYIVSAHYDSINLKDEIKSTDDVNASAPGADDDASGVASVLECARIMSKYRFNATIRFVAFSAEEQGLIGSKHYAEKMKGSDEKIIADIQLDMIGYGNDSIDIIANPESEWIAETMENVSVNYGIVLNVNKVVNSSIRYSDHASFWDNGYCGVCLIENAAPSDYNPYFHSKNDTIEKLNFTLIRKTTQMCITTLSVLANLSLPDLTVSDIKFSDEKVEEGEMIGIMVTIYNTGKIDAKGEAKFYCDNIIIGSKDVYVEVNDSSNVSISWKAVSGKHIISVMIEDCTPIESNTSNNMVSKMIAVSKAAPEPVSSFDFLFIVLIGAIVSGIMMKIR